VNSSCFNYYAFRIFCVWCGGWTQGLGCVRQMLSCWATSPARCVFNMFIIVTSQNIINLFYIPCTPRERSRLHEALSLLLCPLFLIGHLCIWPRSSTPAQWLSVAWSFLLQVLPVNLNVLPLRSHSLHFNYVWWAWGGCFSFGSTDT
jgi:hypothetical protein